jgi:monoamine oxidase
VNGFNWVDFPWSKGAYSAYTPGQWTRFYGQEQRAVGKVHFAGEHCSREFKGYMNGAAETGRHAAEEIMAFYGQR